MTGLFIHAKLIQLVTGKSSRAAYRRIEQMKDSLGKKEHQSITIDEYCMYEGIKREELKNFLLKFNIVI